jgi:hypothetical protein
MSLKIQVSDEEAAYFFLDLETVFVSCAKNTYEWVFFCFL